MSYDKTGAISVTAMRADGYSDDGRSRVISLKTKYSAAERRYSVPVECFNDLIVDLQRLVGSASTASSSEAAGDPVGRPIREETKDG